MASNEDAERRALPPRPQRGWRARQTTELNMSDDRKAGAGLAAASGSDASTKPKLSDDQIATRLCAMLTQEMMYKADCFDYLCWLNETEQRENVKTADFLVMASDGTTCWGKTYSDAVKVAMHHDKELYDAVQNLVLPEDEHQNEKLTPLPPTATVDGKEKL